MDRLSSSVPKFDLGPFLILVLKKSGHILVSVIKGQGSHICRVCYKQTGFRDSDGSWESFRSVYRG